MDDASPRVFFQPQPGDLKAGMGMFSKLAELPAAEAAERNPRLTNPAETVDSLCRGVFSREKT